ncbi:MAG TPA: MMPL family transporter [Kribbellaceae bacterium]|nr:MMPL family transporter [Kribbellaceae bacterium]
MFIGRIASFSMTHKRIVLAGWLLVVVAAFVAAPGLFDRLTSDTAQIDASESGRARQALRAAAPSGGELYAVADGRAADDPGLRASVVAAATEISAIPGVAEVLTPWTAAPSGPADERAVARDGRAVALAVHFAPDARDGTGDKVIVRLRAIDAPRVLVGGGDLLDDEMDEQAAADLAKAELLSTPVVLVLLVLFMGGLVAAGLPVLITIVGAATTLGLLTVASYLTDISVYSVNIVTMLALGLAVDYGLLVVSRFREELRGDVPDAVLRAMSTAGRTVLFSGLTVAASLAGLLVFPDPFLRSAGLAGLAVVLLDLAAALTLLPALLAAVGHRIRPARPVREDRGFFVRLTQLVSRRPVTVIAATVPLLVLAAAPFLHIRFAEPDARSLTTDSPSRQLSDLVESRFDVAAEVEPIVVVAHGKLPDSYVTTLRGLDHVTDVTERPDVPGLTVVNVVAEGEAQGKQALELVDRIRALDAPVPVEVTGDAATLADYQDSLMDRAPFALGIVVLATFVLLFLFTGSVVVPVKALVMNTLSLGASLGALVWVFQDGNLGGLVGTEALGSLSITTPVLMLAIGFGLSMDYEVFLLGRIAEAWRRTGDNARAIAGGLQHTGRIVTAAALLMSVVFAGFVAGGFSPVKQVGLGLLLAVLVDATIVRMLLMPATMTVMGRANWWAPAPLRRLHRRIGLTESAAAKEPALT